MNARPNTDTALVDGSPTSALLEELGAVHGLVLACDDSGTIRWMSDGWGHLCGGRPNLVGRNLHRMLRNLPHPEQMFETRSRGCQGGTPADLHLDVNGHGEVALPLNVDVLPMETPPERPSLFAVIARPEDRAPVDPDRDAAGVLESAPHPLLVVEEDGVVSYANRAVVRLLGAEPELLRGRPLALLAARPCDARRLLAALRSPSPSELDLTLRRGDGQNVRVRAHIAPRQLSDGAARRAVVIGLREADHSDNGRAELLKRNDELEHCINTLAHDLRSPLVALLGFSRLLRQEYGDLFDDTASHFVDRIEQAGRTMEALIHDLLELSRIGQPGEQRTLIDPRTVLIQIHAEVKPRLDVGGIRLEIPENPPLVYCDRTRLYQVFSNLIGNAISYMGDDRDARITVVVAEEDGFHRISVRDTGRGVDPEHHERIFEAFQSLGSRSDGHRGTGIGLAIVRKIAKTHGGHAWIESPPGGGSVFHVTFARS
jgi:PAS domain S-box-containing protein